ncbi:Ubiquitin carboxyl-terminal hydrolase 16 [Podosphaera aphanis]|nr:Ubiquitin carboxyl-terminal hydrolase 16 [Podosphaera aphanis]
MPDKPLTIATYAAGASLAAITLVYVFAPTFFLDGDSTSSTTSSRKKTIVGLSNPANDCFINAVLQALAGLSDLRIYLIRETHRRNLDGLNLYSQIVEDPLRKDVPVWKTEGLQIGTVTQGLKEILNALNERPIYKKTISAGNFIRVLEEAFRQRISLHQQDAQEFLQVVAERLCDEYHAGRRVRNRANSIHTRQSSVQMCDGDQRNTKSPVSNGKENSSLLENRVLEDNRSNIKYDENNTASNSTDDIEEGFPLEGGSESQIECLTCGFKPKPTTTTFCTLTLSVPQVSTTSLSACFDQMFKTEYIEDFKCEKCRLIHALGMLRDEISRCNSETTRKNMQNSIEKIQEAIDINPEKELINVQIPDLKFAPKRKIARHVRITNFPKVLAIHLSRSIFDAGNCTLKNSAKVSFPESLPLGGILNRKFYRLSSVVCHKGSHHSGHYESFRRQTIYPPFSTPDTFKQAGVYSRNSCSQRSSMSTVHAGSRKSGKSSMDISTQGSSLENLSPILTSDSSSGALDTNPIADSQISPNSEITSRSNEKRESVSLRSRARATLAKVPSLTPSRKFEANGSSPRSSYLGGVKRKEAGRWWRISDDKTKESKTADVLNMQREVYLLFYELEKEK